MSTPLRVLIVEDRPADAELLLHELRRAGFEPDWTRVESEADYLARLDPAPDVILADYHLPQFDAPRALELLQARRPDVPLLVVSGTVGEDAAVACMKQGAADYLLKDRLARLGPAVAHALESRRLRDARREAEDALRESEARFRGAFEGAGIGMALQGLDGRYLRVNRALCVLLGYSAADLLGRTFQAVTHPEDLPADLEHDRQMLAGEIDACQAEKRYLHKRGHVVWTLTSVSLVRSRDGRPLYFVVQTQDLTERRRAQEAEAELQARLAQSDKVAAMGQLLAGVAHELNNPLSVVLGQAALLAGAAGDGALKVRADKITGAADRCARIVKNFLALARERAPERGAVRLNAVVRETVELLAYPLRVDDVEVVLDLDADLASLWADPHQLQQVVVNLVTNAHHAMRQTPAPRRLTLATRNDAAGGRLSLTVTDTGPGVPPELQARIFEPFFTTKPPGQGTGLGLSLCQGIVERHGGAIRLESPPGHGAAFRIELPVVAPPEISAETRGTAAPTPLRGKTILVVDDEPDVAGVLADLLAADGHRVETAPNGAVALESLGTRAFDLILSDLRMPEVDGPELYRQAKGRYPELARRFVFLTGDTLAPETAAFLGQVDTPALSKPFALEEVRRVVQRTLGA